MKKKFYFLSVCLFLSLVSFAQSTGPVVYLPLDTDLKDASGNGLDAADGGVIATTFVNDAVRGQVAFFDTACHAVLPKVDTLRFGPGQDFAFSMWMKIDRLGGDPAILGNKDWNNGRNKGFVMYNVKSNEVGAKNLGINFSDGPSDQGGSHNRLYWETFPNGAPDMIDGTWHFIAASFDRDDTLRVWVDGELQYSVVDMSIAPGYAYDNTNDYPIRIMEDGTGTYNNGSGMKGYIDEIRIWNRTITDAEVKAIYAPEEETEGPVVYLPLDTDLKDASGNGLDAADGGVIATTFVNDAVRGQVAFFDTACHAVLPKVDTLRFGPGQDFAFSMWMKIDRLGGDPAILGNKDWNNGRNKGFVMYNVKSNEVGAKNLGINFSDGPSDQGGSHNRLYWETFPNGAPDMIDGTWHFIAASFDRDDTLRVWVDGELQYSVVDMSIAPGYAYDDVNDYPIRIMEDGTGTYNNGTGMKGYIDEVRIWNRVVTDDEIKALYDQTNTAITEIEEASLNTTLYPNPSNGAVNIRFNAKNAGVAQVQVFNSTGAMITGFTHSTIAGQNLATFNVNGWNQGFYFVRVISDSTSETVRLVVAR